MCLKTALILMKEAAACKRFHKSDSQFNQISLNS